MLTTVLFWMLGCFLSILAVAILFDFGGWETLREGKVDRRFKTGYKNNEEPILVRRDPPKIATKLSISGALIVLAWICFDSDLRNEWDIIWRIILIIGASVVTWKAYPLFLSRYDRGGTSYAKYMLNRAIATLLVGLFFGPLALSIFYPMGSVGDVSRFENVQSSPMSQPIIPGDSYIDPGAQDKTKLPEISNVDDMRAASAPSDAEKYPMAEVPGNTALQHEDVNTQRIEEVISEEPISMAPSKICESASNFFSRNNCMWRECEKLEFSGFRECEKYIKSGSIDGY